MSEEDKALRIEDEEVEIEQERRRRWIRGAGEYRERYLGSGLYLYRHDWPEEPIVANDSDEDADEETDDDAATTTDDDAAATNTDEGADEDTDDDATPNNDDGNDDTHGEGIRDDWEDFRVYGFDRANRTSRYWLEPEHISNSSSS